MQDNHALALIQIGMMVIAWHGDDTLPPNFEDLHARILDTFGIDATKEESIFTTRDKMIAIIEIWQEEELIH